MQLTIVLHHDRYVIHCEVRFDSINHCITGSIFSAPTGFPQIIAVKAVGIHDTVLRLEWERERCVDRNGNITHYVVEYGISCDKLSHLNMSIERDQMIYYSVIHSFPVSNITHYKFRVAASNVIGSGPFSNFTSVSEDYKSKETYHFTHFCIVNVIMHHISQQ